MHVQYSLSETTRIHDLSTRKMHLIRGNRRTAVLTNRTICTIRESLLRPVSIRVLRVIVAVCRLFLSTRKRQNNTVAQLSPLLHRSVRFVKRLYDPCRLDYCMLLPIYMPVNVCMRRGPICEWAVVHKHEHCSSGRALTNKQGFMPRSKSQLCRRRNEEKESVYASF